MKKDIKELYEIEKRDPVSIAAWLKAEGLKDECIELALAEFAEKIAKGERFGYVNGISVLSNKVRDRVKELSQQDSADLVARLGKFEIVQNTLIKRIWKQLNRKIF